MEIKLILNILITMMINSIVILPIITLIVDARDKKEEEIIKLYLRNNYDSIKITK